MRYRFIQDLPTTKDHFHPISIPRFKMEDSYDIEFTPEDSKELELFVSHSFCLAKSINRSEALTGGGYFLYTEKGAILKLVLSFYSNSLESSILCITFGRV